MIEHHDDGQTDSDEVRNPSRLNQEKGCGKGDRAPEPGKPPVEMTDNGCRKTVMQRRCAETKTKKV